MCFYDLFARKTLHHFIFMGVVASYALNWFVEAICVVVILLFLSKHSRTLDLAILSFYQTFMVVAMCHWHTLDLHQLGHIVTSCCSITLTITWGGKVGPITTINQIERLWWQFFLNPSQWWDCRTKKVNPNTTTKGVHVHQVISLDFEWIHRYSQQGLMNYTHIL